MFGICIKLMGITWASVCLFSHIKADRTDRDGRQTLSVSLRGDEEAKKSPRAHMLILRACLAHSSHSAGVEQAEPSSRDGLGGPVLELLAIATLKVALYIAFMLLRFIFLSLFPPHIC